MPKARVDGVRLSELIAPAFYPVYWDVAEGLHTYYDLYGGRGSTKSSFIGLMIPLGIMQDPMANAIIFRKVASTLSTSVYAQIEWGLDALGVSHLWKCTSNPMKMVYKPTGQVILFRGLDKARKLKSIKVPHGYLKYCWFEELDEFDGEEEIRSVQQSVLRGGPKYVVFKSFNPPISKSNWANQYVMKPRASALRHKSCYLDVNPEWLGQQFLDDADDLKATNPRAYQHEYLGDAVGTGGEVFDNLDIRILTDAEIAPFDNIYMGIDWGWYPDPFHWSKMHFDPARRTLYIYDEFRAKKMSNAETWNNLVMKKGVTGTDLITADSAEPKSIGDYRDYGSLCRPAIKGPDSRRYSYKWLQSLKKIVIDPVRCPETAKEFINCEYERTKDDELTGRYPEVDDHCLVGDTIVNTPDGDFRIADLVGKTGRIYSYDISGGKRVSTFTDCHITLRDVEIYEVELEDGKKVRCTADHPILTHNRGYVRAEDLTCEDDVVEIEIQTGQPSHNKGDDRKMRVKAVRKLEKRQDVYDLTVPKYHNFSVNGGIIVHNSIDSVRYAMERVYKRKGQ